jgi:ketosteroid isomerase-like protein
MSRDNVELVRRSFEAFSRGDLETAFAAHAPDTEWRSARFRGMMSGVEIDVAETYAVRVTGGRIVRVEEYRTTEEALEALGEPG